MAQRLRGHRSTKTKPNGADTPPAPPADADGDDEGGSGTEGVADAGSNLTAAVVQQFWREAKAARVDVSSAAADLAAAKAVLKGAYRRAEKDGVPIKAFREALDLSEQGHDERVSNRRHLDQILDWVGIPIGGQRSFDFAGVDGKADDPEMQPDTMPEHRREQIAGAGFNASKAGFPSDKNPWHAGSFAHQVWHGGWIEQQGEAARALGQ